MTPAMLKRLRQLTPEPRNTQDYRLANSFGVFNGETKAEEISKVGMCMLSETS
jgi:hypothetical protein